ncbi:protein of unknown function [Granulicella rosea]|uniref:DUF4145 domain-containing protein n=1 Tax=Granulicella rosea TaxID=474952 RepID=A0A239HWJ1_9BACT|nr:DUF4145 domain-containing protein [Granulicella rosea]SNS84574.1 protein of unknown function [Granulicella rosea]
MPSGWTCPYCNQIATITNANISRSEHDFNNNNKDEKLLRLQTFVIVCPNLECKEYSIQAALYKTKVQYSGAGQPFSAIDGPSLINWQLRPKSTAKVFPNYIPGPVRQDYEEACMVLNDSPKASATLSRRCLQGIIRDFWKISKNRLVDEIYDLKDKVDANTWAAIDAIRSIGNIGAHMEKDINLIIDVDPGEAELLIRLIETLFSDWYINRHNRDLQMQQIVAIAKAKADQKLGTVQP